MRGVLYRGGARCSALFAVSGAGHDRYAELLEQSNLSKQRQEQPPVVSPGSIEVVLIMKTECEAREQHWEVFITSMRTAACAGAISDEKLLAWLANLHVASSSAQVARNVVRGDEEEIVYLFYLRTGAEHRGCMQVRVAGDVLWIDALCSLGGHSGETFIRHLVEWLPGSAPGVTSIEVMPLSDGWLRQDYYAGLGFVGKENGRGCAMIRSVR